MRNVIKNTGLALLMPVFLLFSCSSYSVKYKIKKIIPNAHEIKSNTYCGIKGNELLKIVLEENRENVFYKVNLNEEKANFKDIQNEFKLIEECLYNRKFISSVSEKELQMIIKYMEMVRSKMKEKLEQLELLNAT